MLLPFVLLGLSICAVWLPPIALGANRQLPPWSLLFVAAIVAGLFTGVLQWVAVASLALLAAVAWWLSKPERSTPLKLLATLVIVVVPLAMALHLVPGFHNVLVIDVTRLSDDSAPFKQHANFDKGAVGLLLLALIAPRLMSLRDAQRVARPLFTTALVTIVAVLAFGVAVGFVRWDPKWPAMAMPFLLMNLLFTCVAEEAFFRGLIQERLARVCQPYRALMWLPVALSTALFAITHLGGGWLYVGLVAIAGLGYSLAYAWTQRIEAAVLTHFAVNSVHFLGFSYPFLAK